MKTFSCEPLEDCNRTRDLVPYCCCAVLVALYERGIKSYLKDSGRVKNHNANSRVKENRVTFFQTVEKVNHEISE